MPSFDWFFNGEGLTNDYAIVQAEQSFSEVFTLLPKPIPSGVIDNVQYLGTYDAKVFDEDGNLLEDDDINILQNVVINAAIGGSTATVSGSSSPSFGMIEIDIRATNAPQVDTYTSFNAVPAKPWAIIRYKAPLTPAYLLKLEFYCDYTYNAAGPLQGHANVYLFVIVDYETLTNRFVALVNNA